jgi:predicted Zn-dependent peptidase
MMMSISISTLSNGLRVISDSNERVDSAAVGVWVNVGSRTETAAQNGIAHFLEHMAFKGTGTRSALDIAESIENVGGYLNAYTSREVTAYYARVLKEDVHLATDIISDILQNSVFDPAEMEKERDVILQEIAQAHDTPDDIIFDHFQDTAYSHQAVGRPILGPVSNVKSFTNQDLKDFISNYYSASRMVIAAAGHHDHEQLVAMAEEKFGSIQQDSPMTLEPAEYKGGSYVESRDIEQLHLLLGYQGVPLNDPDYYTVSVLSTLFGGGMSSKLFQEVREKRGLAYSIYSFKSSFTDSGLFGIYAGTAPHQAEELIGVVQEQTAAIYKNVSGDSLKRAKAQLKASLLMGLENIPTRCEQLAQHMLFFGRPVSRAEVVDRIDAVSIDDIVRVAKTIFSTPTTRVALGNTKHVPSSYGTEGVTNIAG